MSGTARRVLRAVFRSPLAVVTSHDVGGAVDPAATGAVIPAADDVHALRAAGGDCPACGRPFRTTDPVRRRGSGDTVHDVCPR